MKKLSLCMWMLIASFVFVGCSSDDDEKLPEEKKTVVISFEGELSGNKNFYTGKDGTPDEYDYYYQSDFQDPMELTEFTHYYVVEDIFGGGFTYTNQTDKTTPGYNNLSAVTGKGKNGTTYLTVNANSFTPARLTLLNSKEYKFKSLWVSNSTYAYLAIADGNDGAGFSKKFEEGDWFKLTIKAYNEATASIGNTEFYLADFRNGKTEIIKEWTEIDLSQSQFQTAEYLEFELSSSDAGEVGMNTPSYFCIDEITLEER